MINRLILASAGLLLILIPGAGGWQAHNLSISLLEVTRNSQWITTTSDEKQVYTTLVKQSDEFAGLKGEARINKQDNSLPDSAGLEQHADKDAGINRPNQTAARLWQQWETLLKRSEFQQIPIIGTLLADRLRKRPDRKVYQSMANLLLQPNIAIENKAILLDLLAEISTPDALTQLINMAEQERGSPLYILVLQAISRIGDNRWDGEFHNELSPGLEAAWSNPENIDQEYLAAVGKAIAAIGAPEGVDQLLLTVSGSNKNKETEATNRIKQEVAFEVIPQVRNPDAVEVLSIWFRQEPLGTPAFEVSGDALSEIGNPAATQTIVNWATEAPAEGARNLNNWMAKIDDDSSLKSISAAQDLEFQNPEIEAVIHKVATSIDSDSALSITILGEDSGRVQPLPLLGRKQKNN